MKWLDTLDRKFGRFHLPYLTETIIGGQIIFYALLRVRADHAAQIVSDMAFTWTGVLGGDWWRLFTFVLIPPQENPVFVIFSWYIFYLMGTALDHTWGTFRYNIYLLIAYLATIGIAWFVPDQPMDNGYIGISVFLAFAFLYPDFEILIFFILPVRMKWLAWIAWAFIAFAIGFGNLPVQLAAAAAVLNFFVFFGGDMVRRIRSGKRSLQRAVERRVESNKPFHVCTVCGKTDRSDPDEDFRYCPECYGSPCYCSQHINNHEHIPPPKNAK